MDWIDVQHYARFSGGNRDVGLRMERRTGKDSSEAYFPPPAGASEAGSLSLLNEALLSTAGESTRWTQLFVAEMLCCSISYWVR